MVSYEYKQTLWLDSYLQFECALKFAPNKSAGACLIPFVISASTCRIDMNVGPFLRRRLIYVNLGSTQPFL